MKLKVKHFDINKIEALFEPLKHINFSLFIDDIPETNNEMSDINILILQEPNEYFGLHDYAIKNKHLFSVILTWDDKVLRNCENSQFLPFGHTWFTKDQYEVTYKKNFQISHLSGNLLKTYGQSLRHEIIHRQNEISIPKKFFTTYGDRYDIENARKGKQEVFADSMFGVAIENTSHNGYFSEKILDLFLLKTIPIYWGCSDINLYFNQKGIIKFENVDHFIYISNKLTESDYISLRDVIEENYLLALKYVNYEQCILNRIIEIFKDNNIK